MKASVVALAVLAAAALTACDETSVAPEDAPRAQATAAPSPEKTHTARARRVPRVPPRPKTYLGIMGGYRGEVEQAMEDLKHIGLWRELTDHLYRIELRVRAGRDSVPNDGHLADARFWKATIGLGTYDYPEEPFCLVRFFPAAMNDDLLRWSSYYARGLTAQPPPTSRQFWAAILGHELSHCPAKGEKTAPESVALAWESRILAELGAAGVE